MIVGTTLATHNIDMTIATSVVKFMTKAVQPISIFVVKKALTCVILNPGKPNTGRCYQKHSATDNVTHFAISFSTTRKQVQTHIQYVSSCFTNKRSSQTFYHLPVTEINHVDRLCNCEIYQPCHW